MLENEERHANGDEPRSAGEQSAGQAGDEAATDEVVTDEAATDEGKAEDGSRSRKDVWDWGFSDFQDALGDIVGSLRNLPQAAARYSRHDLIQVPGQGYWLLLDLPGVEKREIEVTVVGDDLTVTGERRRPDLPEDSEVLGSSRTYGRFRREIRIPSDVDHAAVKAKLESGVLKVVLPRRAEAARQRIEIEE